MLLRLPKIRLPRLLRAVEPKPLAAKLEPSAPVQVERDAEAVSVPLGTYRWIYRSNADYSAGDLVTHGGQVWAAMRDVYRGTKPGQSDSWRLAVRRGSNGADGRDLVMVDAEVIFEREPITRLTTRVKLRELISREPIASITPQRDAEGFMVAATIKVA